MVKQTKIKPLGEASAAQIKEWKLRYEIVSEIPATLENGKEAIAYFQNPSLTILKAFRSDVKSVGAEKAGELFLENCFLGGSTDLIKNDLHSGYTFNEVYALNERLECRSKTLPSGNLLLTVGLHEQLLVSEGALERLKIKITESETDQEAEDLSLDVETLKSKISHIREGMVQFEFKPIGRSVYANMDSSDDEISRGEYILQKCAIDPNAYHETSTAVKFALICSVSDLAVRKVGVAKKL